MTTVYFIRNEWNDRLLSDSNEWRNDGPENCFSTDRSVMEDALEHYKMLYPADADRVSIGSYELDEEA